MRWDARRQRYYADVTTDEDSNEGHDDQDSKAPMTKNLAMKVMNAKRDCMELIDLESEQKKTAMTTPKAMKKKAATHMSPMKVMPKKAGTHMSSIKVTKKKTAA